jgi:hypothetical protein
MPTGVLIYSMSPSVLLTTVQEAMKLKEPPLPNLDAEVGDQERLDLYFQEPQQLLKVGFCVVKGVCRACIVLATIATYHDAVGPCNCELAT